jgi:hypothetical protein
VQFCHKVSRGSFLQKNLCIFLTLRKNQFFKKISKTSQNFELPPDLKKKKKFYSDTIRCFHPLFSLNFSFNAKIIKKNFSYCQMLSISLSLSPSRSHTFQPSIFHDHSNDPAHTTTRKRRAHKNTLTVFHNKKGKQLSSPLFIELSLSFDF